MAEHDYMTPDERDKFLIGCIQVVKNDGDNKQALLGIQAELAQLRADNERLQERTLDGVLVGVGDAIWWLGKKNRRAGIYSSRLFLDAYNHEDYDISVDPCSCYSSYVAVQAAAKERPHA